MRTDSVSPPRSDPSRLPSYCALSWMLFMQPAKLKRTLAGAGIEQPTRPVWALLRERGPEAPVYRAYVLRLLILLCVVGILAGLGFALLLAWMGYSFLTTFTFLAIGAGLGIFASRVIGGHRRNVGAHAVSATIGMAIGGLVAAVQTVRAGGPASVTTGRVLLGVLLGLVVGPAFRVALGAASFVTFGLASLVRWRLVASVARHMSDTLLFVGAPAAGAVVVGAVVGWIANPNATFVPALWTASLLLMLALPRLLIYPVELAASWVLAYLERVHGRATLAFVPVLWHELSYLPYPFLREHLLAAAERDPGQVREVLDACGEAPAQREVARDVLARLQAREIEALVRAGDFVEVANLKGPFWLPGAIEGAPRPLFEVGEIGALVVQAEGVSPHARISLLERAHHALKTLDRRLVDDGAFIAEALRETFPSFQRALDERSRAAREEAKATLPNPFQLRSISPTTDHGVFRGRERLVGEIRSLLVDGEHGSSIALLGPRRCGKTSLLKMLPVFLTDTICVFFDTQAHAMSTPAQFFVALARQTREIAERRGIQVPALAEGADFDAGASWLAELPGVETSGRILVCLDEAEQLEKLYAHHPRDTDRLLGLLRATMQHQSRVGLILSAKAPFQARPELWSDHFISVQEIWLDHLDERDAVDLLTRPTPDFPGDVVSEELARDVFQRTGGQPYLLQAFGYYLILRLNEAKRRTATLADVEAVEDKVLDCCDPYFDNVVRDAPQEAQPVLAALAEGERVVLTTSVRRWLRNSRLLAGDGGLRIPVLGRWIREHALDLAAE